MTRRKNETPAEFNARVKESAAAYRALHPAIYRAARRKWADNNPEKSRQVQRASDARWRALNPDKAKECADTWRAENPDKAKRTVKQWKLNNKSHNNSLKRASYHRNSKPRKAAAAVWKSANAGLVSAHHAKRRACKLNATPKWADLEAIAAIYSEARAIEKKTGIQVHVDHRVPLISDRVCGLHVHYNLRIIPAGKNIAKGNRTWPNMTICVQTRLVKTTNHV